MGRAVVFEIIAVLSLLTTGCATSDQQTARWISDHGGLQPSTDARQARVEAVGRSLVADGCASRITFEVLATDAVTAYSLGDGHVFVTRGLVDRLDDDELRAAVAHEFGHLINDGYLATAASLGGTDRNADQEAQADATGVNLLRSHHLAPDAMVRMLQTVETYGNLKPATRQAVAQRIERLRSSIR